MGICLSSSEPEPKNHKHPKFTSRTSGHTSQQASSNLKQGKMCFYLSINGTSPSASLNERLQGPFICTNPPQKLAYHLRSILFNAVRAAGCLGVDSDGDLHLRGDGERQAHLGPAGRATTGVGKEPVSHLGRKLKFEHPPEETGKVPGVPSRHPF